MSVSSGYEDEMGRFLRLSDEELSRLLAGEAGVRDEALEQVGALLAEVRETFAASAPDGTTREIHLAAISEAAQLAAEKGNPVVRPVSKVHGPVGAQVSGLPKWRRVMSMTKTLILRAAAGSVAASLSMFGLAYAGVDLPGQAAEQALEAVTGVELPNQGPEESVAGDVKSVVESDLEGCERGQAVAGAADANRDDEATTETDPCAKADEAGEARGSKATGAEKSAEGRAKASDASAGASDAGADNAAEASGAGADNAGTNDDGGRATGENASSSGSANAETRGDSAGTNDDAGRSTGDEASSGGSSTAGAGSENAGSNDEAGRTTGDDATTSAEEIGSSASEEGQSNNPTGNGRP